MLWPTTYVPIPSGAKHTGSFKSSQKGHISVTAPRFVADVTVPTVRVGRPSRAIDEGSPGRREGHSNGRCALAQGDYVSGHTVSRSTRSADRVRGVPVPGAQRNRDHDGQDPGSLQ